jgi:hypothetical protein
LAAPGEAAIVTVDVASVVWTLEGQGCTSTSTDACESVFTFNYLWLVGANPGPNPAPAVAGEFGVTFSGPPATSHGPFSFLDVSDLSPVDIVLLSGLGVTGLPDAAEAAIAFNFHGAHAIGPQLLAPVSDLFDANGDPSPLGVATLFQFDYDDAGTPVPEPAPSVLLAIAVGFALTRLNSKP